MMNANLDKIYKVLQTEKLPACVIDLDAFDRNLNKLIKLMNPSVKQTLRLASKSVRVPALLARAAKNNAVCGSLMIYSVEEIQLLSQFGFSDFLIAYPTVQSFDLDKIYQAIQSGLKIRLIVDHQNQIDKLISFLKNKNTQSLVFDVVIDVDASVRLLGLHLGVRRSPIRNVSDAVKLAKRILSQKELKFAGLMMYEAQVAGLTDRNPFKKLLNPIAHLVRVISKNYVRKFRNNLYSEFQKEKIPVSLFNGGGTGSFNFANQESCLTELTAGSALFSSHIFDYYSNIAFEPACFFALQVVRSSDEGYVTCQGGGYIASGEPGWDRLPVPVYPKGLKLVSSEGCGEVQTPLSGASSSLTVGDIVLFRHAKAGEVMERFNEVLLYSNGKIVGREKTYRGFGLQTY